MAKKEAKIIFTGKVKCPHCKKRIVIKKTKKILEPAVPADVEEKVIVEKDDQTTLNEE